MFLIGDIEPYGHSKLTKQPVATLPWTYLISKQNSLFVKFVTFISCTSNVPETTIIIVSVVYVRFRT
jgi:hypothetical protein